jgi:uncharacterized protein (TIGR02145 family)
MQQAKVIVFAMLLVVFGLSGCRINSVKDFEGNKYKTVIVGTQVWMAENLKATRLNDGTEINLVPENDAWVKQTTPAYSWYFNDKKENQNKFGALYNWSAINSGKLCPAGWRIPAESDWLDLAFSLNGMDRAGGKMKEIGSVNWKSPNTDATNESGFSALPGGYRSIEGVYNYAGIAGYWWSSTKGIDESIIIWYLRYKSGSLYKTMSEKYCGFSVRCLKDK